MTCRLRQIRLLSAMLATAAAMLPGIASRLPAQGTTLPIAFEVATVKPVAPGSMVETELRVYPGGRLVIHGHTLHGLIGEAFNLPGWQVSGGDKWVDQQRFDIEAKPPMELRDSVREGEYANGGIQDPRTRAMLQDLLVERFQLKFHTTSQRGTVYHLQRGTGPLRLKVAELSLYRRAEDGTIAQTNAYPTGDIGIVEGGPVSLHQTSMRQLAQMLSNFERAPVSDLTRLLDFYDFSSQTIVTREDFLSGPPLHLLIEAVPEMGLKLVKTEGSVERFVIDHAVVPTSN